MNKYLKYTSLIFAGVLFLSPVVYAENIMGTTNIKPENKKPSEPLRQDLREKNIEIRDQVEQNREETKTKLEQEREIKKAEFEVKREELKKLNEADREAKREDLKKLNEADKEAKDAEFEAKKEEFKKQMELKKEEVKSKIEANKEKFKKDLLKIKDGKKQLTVEKIVSKIAELNTKAVNNLNDLTDKIEAALLRIEIRANDAEVIRGVDVSTTRTAIVTAKASILNIKALILAQSTKSYTANITTDAQLQAAMSTIKESLNGDIKILRDKVKAVHENVKTVATTLAQTPHIDDLTNINTNTTTTTTSTTTPVENNTTGTTPTIINN